MPGIAPPRLLIRLFIRTCTANPLFHVRCPPHRLRNHCLRFALRRKRRRRLAVEVYVIPRLVSNSKPI